VEKRGRADRPQMTLQYSACDLHVGYLRLQTHTLGMYNIIAFPPQKWLHESAYFICALPVLVVRIGSRYSSQKALKFKKLRKYIKCWYETVRIVNFQLGHLRCVYNNI
jgi:hypothetical protein